ncbi:PA domain-containing protein [Xanthomonas phaseoli]|uniref:PA domain-containing protein n=1 Tax=Xanthomonas phaseoli TaxID=1985254 RepID=UPI001ADBA846|nr:PA domain-containing protein [Xanthomonas phaseoli]MBO9793739.1 serine protease [Xanthomonas phaseoli pv. dieffenbachiae]
MNKPLLLLSLAVAAALAPLHARAANVTLINGDAGTVVGLNDPTAAAPLGGNPGRTIGEQRRIAYQYAMDLWGAVLQSNVEIKVYASFARLTCTATGGTLGQAGPNWIVNNFPGAKADTLYPSALGDAIAGQDLVPDPADPADVFSQFNGDLGKDDCLAGSGWYLGLDGKTPEGQINFLNVVMHEIGHGLGAAGFLNKTTGVLGSGSGLTDVYTSQAYDNVQNKRFDDPTMTNAMRAEAMRTPGRTVWAGTRVNREAALILDPRTLLRVTAPASAAGKFEVGFASFGPLATAANFPARSVVTVNDGVAAASASDGCETPFVNAAEVAGKVALIDRGTCAFAIKVKNAQLNGAVGVIVANNAAGVQTMGNAAPPITDITIPAIMVSQADGARLKGSTAVVAALYEDPQLLQGTDSAGRTRLYSPSVVAGGSTFSHFDTDLQPNALMEPFDTPEVQAHVNIDLTPALFADIGWTLNTGPAKLGTCNTLVPTVETGGLIPGANVSAESSLCKTQNAGNRLGYLTCMDEHARELQSQGVISRVQQAAVFVCATKVRP